MNPVICILGVAVLVSVAMSFGEDLPDVEENSHRESHCVCKPSVRIEMFNEETRPICNNATVNWLLNTALERISKQSEWMNEVLKEIKKMEQELSKSQDLMAVQEKEVTAARKKITKLMLILAERDARIRELEPESILLATEKRSYNFWGRLDTTIEKCEEKWKADLTAVRLHPRDCADVQENGMKYSGIYTIYPRGPSKGLEVFCDLNTDGGFWTVIQRRQDGSESFKRTWAEYKEGFGVIAKEFWIGNDNIHQISSQRLYELRIDMIDFDSVDYFAIYSSFLVNDESDKYRLRLGQYTGNAGDSLSSHDGWPFSTMDSDNDGSRSGNCSELYGGGGWWYARCYDANLNGCYMDEDTAKRIVWYQLPKNKVSSLRATEMKIRPCKTTDSG